MKVNTFLSAAGLLLLGCCVLGLRGEQCNCHCHCYHEITLKKQLCADVEATSPMMTDATTTPKPTPKPKPVSRCAVARNLTSWRPDVNNGCVDITPFCRARRVVITGKACANDVTVNVMHPRGIVYHLNNRMAVKKSIVNSRIGRRPWGKEKTIRGKPFPFVAGKAFTLEILMKNRRFTAKVNGEIYDTTPIPGKIWMIKVKQVCITCSKVESVAVYPL